MKFKILEIKAAYDSQRMALPKRFPEREEISAVRAEAEKAEPGESLDRGAPAGRPGNGAA